MSLIITMPLMSPELKNELGNYELDVKTVVLETATVLVNDMPEQRVEELIALYKKNHKKFRKDLFSKDFSETFESILKNTSQARTWFGKWGALAGGGGKWWHNLVFFIIFSLGIRIFIYTSLLYSRHSREHMIEYIMRVLLYLTYKRYKAIQVQRAAEK